MSENVSKIIQKILGEDDLFKGASQSTLDDITFHDFAKYEFLLNPQDSLKLDLSPLSEEGLKYINDLEASGSSFAVLEYMADLLVRLEARVRRGCEDGLPSSNRINTIIVFTPEGIFTKILKPLYTIHRRLIRKIVDLDREFPNYLDNFLYNSIRSTLQNIDFTPVFIDDDRPHYARPIFDWVAFIEGVSLKAHHFDLESSLEFPFEFYPEGSVNVGISLVYRQRWKSIGTQPGEIIKTIPLGPGQSEKIITTIKTRKKSVTKTEDLEESETSNEDSDSSKDSTEVVAAAASNENWSLSASASYGVGGLGFGASASGEMGGSKEQSSKDTSAALSEKMKKTASKMRRQSKVSVTTETESEYEESATSQVSNKNDEVALTLQYHMLQHQYDVYTYLFSVKNCIFIAEKIPAPYEVNVDWVRRYDWIIAEELINESYRKTLNELIQDEDVDSLVSFSGPGNEYSKMVAKVNEKFASFNSPANLDGLGGLNMPDIYAEPQRQYDAFRKEEQSRQKAQKIRDLRRGRLLTHIRDNILHYCRAIWAREDAEQRMFRYKKEGRTVPIQWEGPLVEDQASAQLYEPTTVRASMQDLISDITPIGFTGNYVVFELAPTDSDSQEEVGIEVDTPTGSIKLPLQEVLNMLRSEYTNDEGTGLEDPAFGYFLKEANSLAPGALSSLDEDIILDFQSFLPHLRDQLFDQNGELLRNPDQSLQYSISTREWAEYLFKKNATRRFLVDSNNLYISLVLGDGVALEPFKRAHRYIDVLTADQLRIAEELKNERRDLLKNTSNNFDPDITKVVVAGGTRVDDIVGGELDTN